MQKKKKKGVTYMVVGQVEAVNIDSNNVLGRDKEAALHGLDMSQDIRSRIIIKELDNITLVRVVDDKETALPGLGLGILVIVEWHASRVEIIKAASFELYFLGRSVLGLYKA
jgi:hypothetical protein